MPNRAQRRATAPGTKTDNSLPIGTPLPHDTQVIVDPAPSLYASGMQLSMAGNDFMLQFNRHVMGRAMVGGVMIPVAQVSTVAEIILSPLSLKDVSLVLSKAVVDYEQEFGEIETAFTRKRASEKTS